jgi:signal transduction histidine kinase
LASLEAELAKRMSRDQQVQNSAENISKINKTITALLQFSKEYKQIGLERPRWVNVEEVLSRATRELERGGEVTVDNLCVNWKVFADPMIERAFFNILENSLRHGEKVTRITVECGSSGEDGKLRIVFSDNGVGIPVAEKERIFEKGVGKNTGLGLFLVRQILSITGMSIRENGIPGKGARFEITVPKDAFEATSQSLSE